MASTDDLKEDRVEAYYTRKNLDIETHIQPGDVCINDDVYADLEMFTPYSNTGTEHSQSVFDILNHCQTYGGSEYLKELLQNPITSANTIYKRMKTVQDIHEIDMDAKPITDDELTVHWFLGEHDENIQKLLDTVYFSGWIGYVCNQSPTLLTCMNFYRSVVAPIAGILYPLFYIIVPYIMMKLMGLMTGQKDTMSFTNYVKTMYNMWKTTLTSANMMMKSGFKMMGLMQYTFFGLTIFMYFHSLFSTIEIARTTRTVCRYLCETVDKLWQFIDTGSRHIVAGIDVSAFFTNVVDDEPYWITHIKSVGRSVQKGFVATSLFGQKLRLLKTIPKEDMKRYMKAICMADAVRSIRRMQLSHSLKQPTLSKYIYLEQKELWHPSIGFEESVRNDLTMKDKGIIITGPNAGGKSTYMKSSILSVILAQTVGLSNTVSMRWKPFTYIATQFNVPDITGYASLYEAEMQRAYDKLTQVQRLQSNDSALIAMDEIFNSTNVIDGISGGYAVAQRLASQKNVFVMLTTHYLYLTKLSKEGLYRNLKVDIERDENDDIHFPYTISKGVSRERIALELMKRDNFAPELVECALKIKTSLSS